MADTRQNGNLLRLNNISVVYSDVIQVLKGVSLDVEEHRIVSLLGGNGAGKTTTLNAICGIVRAGAGRVALADEDIAGLVLLHRQVKAARCRNQPVADALLIARNARDSRDLFKPFEDS